MTASASQTVAFAIGGPIARTDLPGLCDRVCALLKKSDAEVAICDVRGVDPDAVTVDALARLQLAAGRHGCQVRLRGASNELRELLAFMGLDRRPAGVTLRLESRGHAEEREERLGAEEERELDDAAV